MRWHIAAFIAACIITVNVWLYGWTFATLTTSQTTAIAVGELMLALFIYLIVFGRYITYRQTMKLRRMRQSRM